MVAAVRRYMVKWTWKEKCWFIVFCLNRAVLLTMSLRFGSSNYIYR